MAIEPGRKTALLKRIGERIKYLVPTDIEAAEAYRLLTQVPGNIYNNFNYMTAYIAEVLPPKKLFDAKLVACETREFNVILRDLFTSAGLNTTSREMHQLRDTSVIFPEDRSNKVFIISGKAIL